MTRFKRGDVREDGMVFIQYDEGKPYWSTPEMLEAKRKNTAKSRNKSLSTKEGHARHIFRARKKYAKRDGIPFTITFEEVYKLIQDVCPVLNTPISWGVRKGQTGSRQNSPSLDKFNPNLGYVPGNVYWISFKANTMKQNATAEEVLALANWMKKINNGN
jgi:hypothetical protein